VAVLTSHVERERELSHALNQTLTADVLGEELQILALPRAWRGLGNRRGGERKNGDEQEQTTHGSSPGLTVHQTDSARL
jgi:hypothetical protein